MYTGMPSGVWSAYLPIIWSFVLYDFIFYRHFKELCHLNIQALHNFIEATKKSITRRIREIKELERERERENEIER